MKINLIGMSVIILLTWIASGIVFDYYHVCPVIAPLTPKQAAAHTMTLKTEIVQPGSNTGDLAWCDNQQALFAYIRERESQGATAEELHKRGKAGELGVYQITDAFRDDHLRRTGEVVDSFDIPAVEAAIVLTMEHYCPLAGATTIADAYEVYHLGYSGYKRKVGK